MIGENRLFIGDSFFITMDSQDRTHTDITDHNLRLAIGLPRFQASKCSGLFCCDRHARGSPKCGLTYQYNSSELGRPFVYIGCAICVVSDFRASISILGLKEKISAFAYLPHLKVALILNSLLWGLIFCLDAW